MLNRITSLKISMEANNLDISKGFLFSKLWINRLIWNKFCELFWVDNKVFENVRTLHWLSIHSKNIKLNLLGNKQFVKVDFTVQSFVCLTFFKFFKLGLRETVSLKKKKTHLHLSKSHICNATYCSQPEFKKKTKKLIYPVTIIQKLSHSPWYA